MVWFHFICISRKCKLVYKGIQTNGCLEMGGYGLKELQWDMRQLSEVVNMFTTLFWVFGWGSLSYREKEWENNKSFH